MQGYAFHERHSCILATFGHDYMSTFGCSCAVSAAAAASATVRLTLVLLLYEQEDNKVPEM